MQTTEFLVGLKQGLLQGARVFVAPLRPAFWRALASHGVAGALTEARRKRPRRPAR